MLCASAILKDGGNIAQYSGMLQLCKVKKEELNLGVPWMKKIVGVP